MPFSYRHLSKDVLFVKFLAQKIRLFPPESELEGDHFLEQRVLLAKSYLETFVQGMKAWTSNNLSHCPLASTGITIIPDK